MRFTKMQGVGNDFVVVAGEELPPDVDLAALAVRTCDRKFGIGADGLLTVSRDDPDATFRMRMFNPDGSEDTCGNGLRCVSLWAHRAGWLRAHGVHRDDRKDGVRAVRLLEVAEDGTTRRTFGVEMGVPKFEPADSAVRGPAGRTHRRLSVHRRRQDLSRSRSSIRAARTRSSSTTRRPTKRRSRRVSPLIENHPLFPERTSVLWATPLDDSRYRRPHLGARSGRNAGLRHGRMCGGCGRHRP